ncbi:TPA: hypothetical protein ACGBG5_001503 [Enterococcus faecalis]
MKCFSWSVETIVCKEDYSLEIFPFEIETLNESKQEVVEIALYKTKALLEEKKQKCHRSHICWLALKNSYCVSEYQQFARLYENKRPRKAIMCMLHIPFWKLVEYENYYNGKTKRLTRKKYSELRKYLSNEKIRRRYKIPRCEFQQFLEN